LNCTLTARILVHVKSIHIHRNREFAMYQADPSPAAYARSGNIFHRAEDWLDARGRWAWIAAMVLGFVIFWPVGLGLLAYMIWGKRMFNSSCRSMSRHEDRHAERHARWADKIDRKFAMAARRGEYRMAFGSSGNAAFDSYKADMLRRLEEEQSAFEAFLQRLRDAKDKSEFDAFMEDRARSAAQPTEGDTPKGEY
jgi:Protein of unknown function (DUF2852)